MPKILLLDADGVIVTGSYFTEKYCREFGVHYDDFLHFFMSDSFRDCLEGRKDLKEEVLPYLKQWKWQASVEAFLRYWFEAEHNIHVELHSKVQAYRQIGIKVYIATNQEKYRSEYMRKEMGFETHFDGLYSSSMLGIKKPHTEFFEKIFNDLASQHIGLEKNHILFIDDTKENVEAAQALGFKGHFYTSLEGAVEAMEGFV